MEQRSSVTPPAHGLMRKGDSVWGSPPAPELERACWGGNHGKVSPPGPGLQVSGAV